MASRFTKEQLQKIVEQVGHLEKERGEELDREEMQQILAELRLPPELLDEAMLRVHRQEAMQRLQSRWRQRWMGVAIAATVAIAGGLFWVQQWQATLDRVTAVRDRITLTQDDGGNLTTVNRQQAPEVVYRVTLEDAPVGDRLSLQCHWIDPSGTVVHQNRYTTRTITTPVWQTHCRLPLGTGATPGSWRVELVLGDRALEDAEFQVQ